MQKVYAPRAQNYKTGMKLSRTFSRSSPASFLRSVAITGSLPKLMIAVKPGSENMRNRCRGNVVSSHQQTDSLADSSPSGVRYEIEAYETARSVSAANCRNE